MSQVSVVMPAYNAERFLDESIRSILDQTFRDFEFIIIDDGSTDRTGTIISHYANLDSRIKVITQKNMGVTNALNNGIKAAQSPYIARMDADDISLSKRLQYEVDFLQNNPDYVLVGTDFDIVDLQGQVTLQKRRLPYEDDDLRDMLRVNSPFAHGSVMYRRDAFERAGGYRKEGGSAEDYDLWVRLANFGKLYIIQKALFRWRLGDTNITTVSSSAVLRSANSIRSAYNRSLPKFHITASQLSAKERLYSKERYNTLLTAYGKIIVAQLKSGDSLWLHNVSELMRFGKAGRHTVIDRLVKIITRGKKQLRHE